ncbi:hypothetical protein TPHA_0E02320 [Tetrapisispora phaffii CBS 4417]|uniref:Myosin motor domain-containing protein n=1 Tax=Tetrapisispora phaffii (strain ATCC 24235 / CBS 4417 / NBRC 1672 / NRRL Y-8282 / UCD 70-5) TaxID=1071381 RepID=G8BTU6_TETPH|nr:hypothetical protein TPHA_0E02320 [Tetrapisispora phaffii CBS 4417]CCE63324.1 hypothetical protein TPHA_0E02320 [Tetrapisispora phaffii CBS 4417]
MSTCSSSSSSLFWIPTDTEELFVKAELVTEDPSSNNNSKNGNSVEQQVTLRKLSDNKQVQVSINYIWPVNPNIFDKVNDLSELTHLNEPSVLYNLQNRYMEDSIYTYSGLFLVAINPYKQLNIYGHEFIKKYHNQKAKEELNVQTSSEYNSNARINNQLPPHVYNITENVFQNLLKNKQNQSILVTGESGAGKTENTKKILQYLTSITEDHSIESSNKFEKKILNSNPILESFGNSQTVRNNNSSRFGKFIKIKISNFNQKILGAEIEWYLLEKSRIITQTNDERNFHVFYELLAALKQEKYADLKKKLLIESTAYSSYNILNDIHSSNDGRNFEDLINALDTIGFSETEISDIFRIISAILHIGNLQYNHTTGNKNDKQARFSNPELLNKIGELLGITDINELEQSLIKPKSKAGKEWVAKSKNIQQSKSILHALSKNLYTDLFDYIVEKINKTLNLNNTEINSDDTGSSLDVNYIGLLDIAGFEIFQKNSFEQFCINYTNEKLQQFFNNHMFILEQKEYLKENIDWDYIDFGKESKATIDLIEVKSSNPTGILPLLDEESIIPNSSDESFFNKLINNWGDNKNQDSRFKRSKKPDCFILKHYAGDVEYDTLGWLTKNRDPLNEHLLTILSSSSVKIIATFFASDDYYNNSIKVTTASKHREQLKSLVDQLQSTNPHFVRCIIPNNSKLPMDLDRRLVLDQLRCNGVLEGIRIAREGYPNRILFKEFYQRYHFLLDKNMLTSLDLRNYKHNCEILISNIMNISPTLYKIGKTKLFFKAGVLANMEEMIEEKLMQVTVKFNSKIKGLLVRKSVEHELAEIYATQEIGQSFRSYNKLINSSPWFNLYIKLKPLLNSSDDIVKNRKIQENVKNMEEAIKITESQCVDLTRKLCDKESELTNVQALLQEESKKLKEHEMLAEEAKVQEGILTEKLDELRTINKEIESNQAILASENKDYIEKIESLEKSINEQEQETKTLYEKREQKYIIEISELEADLKAKKETLHSLTLNNNELTDKLSKLTKVESEQRLKIKDMELQLSNSENDLDSKLVTLEKNCNVALVRLKTLLNDNSSLKTQIATLKRDHELFEQQLKLKIAETDALQQKLFQQNQTLKTLQQEKSKILLENTSMTKELNKTKENLKVYIQNFQELEQKHRALEEQQRSVKSGDEGRIMKLETRISEESARNKNLSEEIKRMNNDRAMELSINRSIVNESDHNVEKMASKIDLLEAELQDLTVAFNKATENEKNMTSKLRFTETKLASTVLEIQTVTSQRNKLRKIIESSDLKVNLDNELLKVDNTSEISAKQLTLEAQYLRKQLEIETKARYDAEAKLSSLSKKFEKSSGDAISSPNLITKLKASEEKVRQLEIRLKSMSPLRDRTNINPPAGNIFLNRENIGKYEDEVRFYKLENYKLQEFLNNADKKINSLVHSLKQSDTKTALLIDNLERLKVDTEKTNEHNDVLTSKLKQNETQLTNTFNQLDNSNHKIAELSHALNQAENDVQGMAKLIDDLKSTNKEMDKSIWDVEMQRNDISTKLQECMVDLQKKDDQINILKSSIDHYKGEMIKMESNLTNVDELERLREELHSFSKIETEYKKTISNLNYNLETLQNDYEANVAELLRENSHYTSKLEQLTLDRDNIIAENQDISKRYSESIVTQNNLIKELDDIRDFCANLEKKLSSMDIELVTTKDKLYKTITENTDLLNNKAYLEDALKLQGEQIERSSQLIEKLQMEVNDSKLKYDDLKQKKIDVSEENTTINKLNMKLNNDIKLLEKQLADTSEKDLWSSRLNELQDQLTSETNMKYELIKENKVLGNDLEDLKNLNTKQMEIIKIANEERKKLEGDSMEYINKVSNLEKQLSKQQLDIKRMIRDNSYFEEKVEELDKEVEYWKQKFQSLSPNKNDANVNSQQIMT